MLDDQPADDPTEVVDTSLEANPAAPDEGHAAATHDWEKRYNDLRPEFDRTTQRLSEYERNVQALQSDDPDTRLAAAEALGLQLIDDEPEAFEEQDPLDELRKELDDLKGWKNSREQAEAEAARNEAVLNHVNTQITEIETGLGNEFDADELEVIVSLARALQTEDGLPDVRAAWDKLNGVTQKSTQRWAKTKKAPPIRPGGKSATKQPDLDNDRERREWMLEELRRRSQD